MSGAANPYIPDDYVPTTSDRLQALVLAALTALVPASIAAAGTNTGNGRLFDFDLGDGAVPGVYLVTLTDADSFTVAKPDGSPAGAGTVGDRFGGGGIAFSSGAGDVPFVAGDHFSLTVAYPTAAEDRVFCPRDWPSTTDGYPMLKISSPKEMKQGLGPNGPQFSTTTTVRVSGIVTAKPKKKDAGAAVAQAAIGVLQRQIELAVINDYQLFLVIEEMVSVDVDSKVTDQGESHLGEVTMDFSMKFPQGPEDFKPPALSTITEISVFADCIMPASKTGTFAPDMPGYTPTPAPRTQGPDGRTEVQLDLKTEN